ncbi:hypothetical protein Tco_0970210 [Tanacetum coccineum]
MGGGKRPNGVPWCRPPPAEDVLPVPYLRLWRSLPTDLDGLATGRTFMKRRPEECYDLIKNMTAHNNDWDTSAQRNESSSSITYSNLEIASLKLQIEEMNRNLTRMLQTNQQVNTVTPSCETCGGPHSYNDYPATVSQNQNVYAVGAYNQGGNSYQPQCESKSKPKQSKSKQPSSALSKPESGKQPK